MATTLEPRQAANLAAQARQRLVALATEAMTSVLGLVQERLSSLMNEAAPSREMQLRRDAWMAFQRFKQAWCDGTVQTWKAALLPETRLAPVRAGITMELLGTEVVENKIIASRLALDLMEKSALEVNSLRKRLKFLAGEQELSARDIVHPEVLFLALVERWETSGLPRESWQLTNAVVQRHFNEQLQKAYARCNADLIAQGVLPVIDFSPKLNPVAAGPGASSTAPAADSGDASPTPTPAPAEPAPSLHGRRAEDRAMASGIFNNLAGMQGMPGMPGMQGMQGMPGMQGYAGGSYADAARAGAVGERRFGRAQVLLEQVGRLLGGFFNPDSPQGSHIAPSVPLMTALARQPRLSAPNFEMVAGEPPAGQMVVINRVVRELREQSAELKGKAQTDNEKAIIELVALMFQAILQEDRIPTGVRVWFARLQMPVLRVALAEPDFFNKLNHPARQLIDHMGSCVMGFDASGISSTALELEIKRVVQVIEQYPDTGDRVYKKVYEEFQAFLKQHLTEKPSTKKVVGVAQQLEQKETLTIQYTIDLRDRLKDMPVRDEIREFLYKVWAEVLAVSAVRQGGQHAQTLLLKKTATDLIWAASAKPNRADRARVISNLPELLQSLRTGMTLMGVNRSAQDAHIKIISDTLADAFMSKTQAIAEDQIAALAERLANLEDYISDDGNENLPLDSNNSEELLGIEASELDVLSSGTSTASPAMLQWARELDLGAWFTLDHNRQIAQVQYVWRSPLGHLHLFANTLGHSYLIQSARLAAYLQEGLLSPQEDESLTMRATRDALGKIQANPERLLR